MDYCGGGGSPSGLIEKYLGEAYSNVLAVADHMDELVAVAASLSDTSGMPSGAAGFAKFATRAELAPSSISAQIAYLYEKGREGIFIWIPTDLSTFIAADTAQGIFVASALDPVGTTGAWVRDFKGDANASWFGFLADDNGGPSTDNYGALTAALACLRAMRVVGGHVSGYGAGGSTGLLIQGAGFVSARIDVTHSIHIHGSGQWGGGGTQLRWPSGTGGFLFDVGSSGSAIGAMTLHGGWTGGDEGEFQAIQNYQGLLRYNLLLDSWEGDGLYDVNDAGSSGGLHNSNSDAIRNVSVQNCRRAYYNQGGDVNAKNIIGLNGISNRQACIFEAGFLGNFYFGCTTESNGFYPNWTLGTANRPACYVRDTVNGYVWACIGGQEVWCSTNAPPTTGTYNQGWVLHPGFGQSAIVQAYLGAGIPDWFNGILVRPGGGVIHQGDSNRSTFEGLYSEANQVNQFDSNVGSINGQVDYLISVNKSSGTYSPTGPPPMTSGKVHRYNPTFAANVFQFNGYSGGFGYPTTAYQPAVDALYTFYATNFSTSLYFRSLGLGFDNLDGSINAGINALNLSGFNLIRFGTNNTWRVLMDTGALYPNSDNVYQLGGASNRWATIFAGTGTINTSDERTKQDIVSVTDLALDAWGDVQWSQFRFIDSVQKKGDAARLHIGLIAQRIKTSFEAKGLDAFHYGLLCFDSWEDLHEPVTEKVTKTIEFDEPDGTKLTREVEVDQVVLGEDGQPVTQLIKSAGDRYGVRYEEALSMEAAYQRRRADRMEARITALESR